MRSNVRHLVALADRGRSLRNLATGKPTAKPRAPRLLPMRNAVATGRTTVRLYGMIGKSYWDDESVSAADLARTLDQIGPNGIDLHINSGGGDVFDGIAMHGMLLDHASDVEVYVDGLAASAASFIAMAGDKVRVHSPAKMMIHNAAGLAWGDKSVMRELADVLEEIDGTIAGIYEARSGRPAEEWAAFMDAETWFSAQRAVELGLADEVANAKQAPPDEDEDAPEEEPEPDEDAPEEDDSKKEPVEDRRSIEIRAHHAGLLLAMKG
jgi:ATP-dependent Clp protease, protease subunit